MASTKIEITNEYLDVAFESIDASFGYIEHINSQTIKTLAFFKKEDMAKGSEHLNDVLDLMDLYIQLVTKIYSTLRSELGKEFKKSSYTVQTEMHLISTHHSLRSAIEKNDLIAVCDLLEDELLDNLSKWKSTILPELQKLRKY